MQRGEIQAILALPRFKARAALRAQWESLGALSAAVLLMAAAGSWFLVGRTLSPIEKLSRQARLAARSRLSMPVVQLQSPSADAEMSELVGTFNELLERLAQDTEARNRFYAAASHELRTPLQALTGHLGLSLSRPHSPDEMRETIQEAKAQVARLSGLVQDLLLLNQLEMVTSTPPAEPLDLADLGESLLRPLRFALAKRCLDVEADWPDCCEIVASPTHTEMLLRNLVDNAVKYAPQGTTIRLQAEPLRAGGARFEVWNRCDGSIAAPGEIARWFEPFYRPESARHSEVGGSGLGLAIAHAVAQSNGWTLNVSYSPVDGVMGIRAEVVFPHVVSPSPISKPNASSKP